MTQSCLKVRRKEEAARKPCQLLSLTACCLFRYSILMLFPCLPRVAAEARRQGEGGFKKIFQKGCAEVDTSMKSYQNTDLHYQNTKFWES